MNAERATAFEPRIYADERGYCNSHDTDKRHGKSWNADERR